MKLKVNDLNACRPLIVGEMGRSLFRQVQTFPYNGKELVMLMIVACQHENEIQPRDHPRDFDFDCSDWLNR